MRDRQGRHHPWRNKADLNWFKNQTLGGVLIVGRVTWESLPPLPGRCQLVVTNSPDELKLNPFRDPHDFDIESPTYGVLGISQAIAIARKCFASRNLFIVGGAQIYRQALELGVISDAFISRIPGAHGCDTKFDRSFIEKDFRLRSNFEHQFKSDSVIVEHWSFNG